MPFSPINVLMTHFLAFQVPRLITLPTLCKVVTALLLANALPWESQTFSSEQSKGFCGGHCTPGALGETTCDSSSSSLLHGSIHSVPRQGDGMELAECSCGSPGGAGSGLGRLGAFSLLE